MDVVLPRQPVFGRPFPRVWSTNYLVALDTPLLLEDEPRRYVCDVRQVLLGEEAPHLKRDMNYRGCLLCREASLVVCSLP